VQRIGILLVALAILATLGIAGFAALRGRTHPGASDNGMGASVSPTVTPSESPTGPAYFTFQDPVHEFSISRPQGWIARGLTTPDPNIAMVVGPDAPYPTADFVAVTFHNLPFTLRNSDLLAFRDFLVNQLADTNIITFEPTPFIDGHAGYLFTTSSPKNAPETLHRTYVLIDGNRFVSIILQIEPTTDSTALSNLSPIFDAMAQSFKSYHVSPTPTSTATPAQTPAQTPTSTAKP